jgi:hypothetical protein
MITFKPKQLPLAQVTPIAYLCDKAKEGNHGQATILDLLNLEGGHVTLGVAQWVEDATGVAQLTIRQLVVAEDGVLVHAAGLADVLQPGCSRQYNTLVTVD